jgi:pyruvate kinase
VEIGLAAVPRVQRQIIAMGRRLAIPVIVATQMLESMIQNPRPTRAEATDVANAIAQGADAVMLSGESAVGKYPIEAVRALSEIIDETERAVDVSVAYDQRKEWGPKEVMAQEACRIAEKIHAKFILVQSQTGRSARRISRFRPRVPIIALVDNEAVRRKVSLLWGVHALIKSIKVSMYKNAFLFSWLNRHYDVQRTDRAVFVDTPVDSGKIVLSVIERH